MGNNRMCYLASPKLRRGTVGTLYAAVTFLHQVYLTAHLKKGDRPFYPYVAPLGQLDLLVSNNPNIL